MHFGKTAERIWDHSDDSSHAFHDHLLNRSQQCRPSKRKQWRAFWRAREHGIIRAVWLFSDSLIFAGGVTLGAEIMRLIRGEASGTRTGIFLAATGLLLLSTILARTLLKLKSRPPTQLRQPARG